MTTKQTQGADFSPRPLPSSNLHFNQIELIPLEISIWNLHCLIQFWNMAIEEFEISCVADLLSTLEVLRPREKALWFRGHARSKWKLEPTLSRMGKLDAEMQVTKRFQQNAYQFLSHIPEHEWEWMFLMQHYGVPTRLLDWTENPLIALYFAINEEGFLPKEKRPAAALWCLFPRRLNEMAKIVMRAPDDIPAFGMELELNDYLTSQIAQGITSKDPVAIIAPRQFGRVVAQQGAFTIVHRAASCLEDLKDGEGKSPHIVKLLIKRANISHLRKELTLLRINKLFVFPQLENVAAEAIVGI
jgi:hypothetical protein